MDSVHVLKGVSFWREELKVRFLFPVKKVTSENH